jgi:hypothetical protein
MCISHRYLSVLCNCVKVLKFDPWRYLTRYWYCLTALLGSAIPLHISPRLRLNEIRDGVSIRRQFSQLTPLNSTYYRYTKHIFGTRHWYWKHSSPNCRASNRSFIDIMCIRCIQWQLTINSNLILLPIATCQLRVLILIYGHASTWIRFRTLLYICSERHSEWNSTVMDMQWW